MFDIKIEGFDKVQKRLTDMEKKFKSFEGEQEVPLSLLLTTGFMQRYTKFRNFDEMIVKSPFEAKTEEEFKAIPDEGWDKYVKETTKFSSWKEMLGKAAVEYTSKKVFGGRK